MQISLNNLSISYDENIENSESEIWHNNIIFSQNKKYLIKAPSGKGKSSLLNFIYGISQGYSGTIKYDNQNIRHYLSHTQTENRVSKISMVFQGLRLFPELTAFENVSIKNKLTNFKSEKEITYLFQELGLIRHTNKLVKYMSFGQQQRVAIIRSLCQPFNFLLLDEPFSHLDEVITKKTCKIIEETISAQNASLIITSLDKDYFFNYNHTFFL